MPGITNSHQNYEKSEFREQCIKKECESENQSTRFLKIPVCDRLGFLQSSVVVFSFRFTFQSPGLFLSKSNFYYDWNAFDLWRWKRLMYIEKSGVMLTLDSYCYIWVMLTCKRKWVKCKYERYRFPFI